MSYRVGLSGGIGSGKSTVAALFHELGIAVIDTDVISRRLTQTGGAAIPLIQAAFGPEFLSADGSLNRARMRSKAFFDAGTKRKLEAILHPLICTEMLAQANAASHSPYLLLVIPLLFEAPGFRELVQRTLVVDCPEETQLARTMARSSLEEPEVRAIIAQQLPRAERLKLADDVIRNDRGMDALRPQVLLLHRFYLDRSSEMTFRSSKSQRAGD